MSAICFVIAVLFGKQLTLLFVDAGETAIIAYSYEFLLFCTGGYCLLTLVNTVRFTIQGMGFSVFAICSGVMEMIARIYRDLSCPSVGMCICGYLSDSGVFLV